MATYINPSINDAALTEIRNADTLFVCSASVSSYAQASSTATGLALGVKYGISFGAIGNKSPNGREFDVNAITDGNILNSGTATHFALVATGTTTLYCTQELLSAKEVVSGDFNLTSFTIGMPAYA